MINFLFKGILRDSSRSKFPVIVVSIGVFFTVFISAFLAGVFNDTIDINARFGISGYSMGTPNQFWRSY